jgi:hypothetical protein
VRQCSSQSSADQEVNTGLTCGCFCIPFCASCTHRCTPTIDFVWQWPPHATLQHRARSAVLILINSTWHAHAHSGHMHPDMMLHVPPGDL